MPIYLEIEGFHGDVVAAQYSGCISVDTLQLHVNRDIPSSLRTDFETVPVPVVSELRMARESDALSAALFRMAESGDLGDKAVVHLLSAPGHTDIKFDLSNPSLVFSADDTGASETLSIGFSKIDILTTVYDDAQGSVGRWVSGYDLSANQVF